jgi:hypothetical protein
MVRFGGIEVADRAINQMIQRDMSLFDKLVELITNSDDSYNRIGASGQDTHYPIDILYYEMKGKGRNITERPYLFIGVWDRSNEFLDNNKLVQAFAHLGELTGDIRRNRGFWSRGVKQVVLNKGNEDEHTETEFSSPDKILPPLVINFHNGTMRGFVYSPKRGAAGVPVDSNGNPTFLDKRELLNYVKWIDNFILRKVNNRWSFMGKTDPKPSFLSETKNGTLVCFVLKRTETRQPFRTLINTLETSWKLREVMKQRFVRVIDVEAPQDHVIIKPRYPDPNESKLVKDIDEKLDYVDERSGKRFPLHIYGKIFEAREDLQQTGDGSGYPNKMRGGVVILDDRDVPRDCTLFDYNNEPLACRLFGEVTVKGFTAIHEFEERCITGKEDGGTGEYPLTEYHELNQKHPLYFKIRDVVRPLVKKYVEERRRELSSQESSQQWDSIKSPIISEINQIIKDITTELIAREELWFDPGYISLSFGESQEVALILRRQVPGQASATLALDRAGIEVEPKAIELSEEFKEQGPTGVEQMLRGKFNVLAKEGAESGYYTVRAKCKDASNTEREAVLTVAVGIEEQIPTGLPLGISFTKTGYSTVVNKTKELGLLIQTEATPSYTRFISPGLRVEIIPEGNLEGFAFVESNDYTVTSKGKAVVLDVKKTENPVYLTKIKVKGSEPTRITFEAASSTNNSISASCELAILREREHRGFLRDLKFTSGDQPAMRSYFDTDERILYIYTDSYLLRDIPPKDTEFFGGMAFMVFWDELLRQMALHKLTKGRRAVSETIDERSSEFKVELQEIEKKYVARVKKVFMEQVRKMARQTSQEDNGK